MEEKKLLLIVNPIAGRGQMKQYLLETVDVFVKAGYTVTVYTTQAGGDARKLIATKGEHYDLIVSSGGDGTLNESVSGLLDLKQRVGEVIPPLGYIPNGSTNDFASSHGIPTTILEAAKHIVTAKPTPCDVGSFGNRFFTYVAAFGAFTEVSYSTDQDAKNILGHLAYIIEAANSLGTTLQPQRLKIEFEGSSIEDDFIYGMISNSTSVGGFSHILGSDVSTSDGLFEVTLVHAPNNATELGDILIALLKQELVGPSFYTFKASSIHVTANPAVSWTVDGEYGGTLSDMTITNLKHAIKIMC